MAEKKTIWYKKIKQYYDEGTYDKADVAFFVVKGKITAAEYKEITGEELNLTEE